MKRNCDNCGREYEADNRNINRGWGLCCSKSCAAEKREKNKAMNINNITEARFIRLANEKFGTDLLTRFEKLDEELQELFEAFGDSYNGESGLTTRGEKMDHLKDELCDVYGFLTHIAGILGMNQKDMLETVLDKLKRRETDPEYKKGDWSPLDINGETKELLGISEVYVGNKKDNWSEPLQVNRQDRENMHVTEAKSGNKKLQIHQK